MILATLCLEVLKATGRTFKDPVQIEDWKLTLGMLLGGLGKWWHCVHAITLQSWCFAHAFCVSNLWAWTLNQGSQIKRPLSPKPLGLASFPRCPMSTYEIWDLFGIMWCGILESWLMSWNLSNRWSTRGRGAAGASDFGRWALYGSSFQLGHGQTDPGMESHYRGTPIYHWF